MVLRNSVRQMLRTPVKTVLFFLLITLSAAFLSVGVNLLLASQRSLAAYENSFNTIGTVRQKPNMLREVSSWDAARKEYTYWNAAVYDSLIPLSALDFEGAPYVHPPQKRPFYGAYHESYDMGHFYESNDMGWMILELSPLEDCIPSQPVTMEVKRILYGALSKYVKNVLFCDYSNENPKPLYAGKTYIMSVQTLDLSFFQGYEDQVFDSVLIPCTGVESTQHDKTGARIPDPYEYGSDEWEEVTQGYYETPRGQRWEELIRAIKRLPKTIPVIPTNATLLLMSFFTGTANITEGRDISQEEYAKGDKVCLLQRQFARNNGFKLGDTVSLPLYFADYLFTPGPFEGAMYGGLLNAQGKAYPVFEESAYKIVGIYDVYGASYEYSAFDIGKNTVVIPAASVKNSDENNIISWGPMTAPTTSFQIPNGAISLFEEKWSRQGIEGLEIKFYDKGYTRLKMGIEKIRMISMILLTVSAVVMVLVLALFTFLFIARNKKRTAIERSLGFRQGQCAISLLSGLLLIVILGAAVGVCSGAWLGGIIIDRNMNVNQDGGYDLTYSGWVNHADRLADVQVNLQSADFSVFLAIALAVLALGLLIASVGVWRNLQAEPLLLLSMKEEQ